MRLLSGCMVGAALMALAVALVYPVRRRPFDPERDPLPYLADEVQELLEAYRR